MLLKSNIVNFGPAGSRKAEGNSSSSIMKGGDAKKRKSCIKLQGSIKRSN